MPKPFPQFSLYWNPHIHRESLNPDQSRRAIIEPNLSFLHGYLFKTPEDLGIAPAMRNGSYEYFEVSHIKKYLSPNDVFIDVGACVGLYSVVASHIVGSNGMVLAFEPFDVQYLRFNLLNNSCNNCIIYNLAVSDKVGVTYLELDDGNFGNNSRCDKITNNAINSTTIDSVVNNGGIVKMMKIDTQGDEINVILGAMRTIRSSPSFAMIVEVSPKHLDEKNQSWLSLLDIIYDDLAMSVYFWAPNVVQHTQGVTAVDFAAGYNLIKIFKSDLIDAINWELESNKDFFMNIWCTK